MNKKDAKFKVPYKRTANWWANKATGQDGDWAKISNWCRTNMFGRWDYMQEEFWFMEEKDYMLFVLRWM